MKKSFSVIALAVAVVYICIFAKIYSDRPDYPYGTDLLVAKRQITMTEISLPAKATDRQFYLWEEIFDCRQRAVFRGNIKVTVSASTDENGNEKIDEIIDVSATGGDEEYSFLILHTFSEITDEGSALVMLSGCYEKKTGVEKIPLVKYLPGKFLNLSWKTTEYWHSESISFVIEISPQDIEYVQENGVFSKEILNTRKYDYK